MAACTADTGGVQTQASRDTEISSDSVETTNDTETETAETTTTEKISRTDELVRMSGYDKGEPKLSKNPEVTFLYSDEDYDYYRFYYDGEAFEMIHEYDNWKIFDSYKIRNSEDMQLICSALINIYPVHGVDLESYRTSEDMVYEWMEHNIVYDLPMSDTALKESAASVDLDPKDQNKTLPELLSSRTSVDVNN